MSKGSPVADSIRRKARYAVGIDIGGTFTDCVVHQGGRGPVIAKASSTPPDFESGVLNALGDAAAQLGMGVDGLLADSQVLHGCTVGTNALVERRTARVGLLMTSGHTETLFAMRSGNRLRGLSPEYIAKISQHAKPQPLIQRTDVREINERIGSDGNIVAPVDRGQIREAVRSLRDEGAEAIAVALLWSVINDDHEQVCREVIEEHAPGCFVSMSSEVAPRIGEYERITATVVNALIGPVMTAYLEALEGRLMNAGYTGQLGIMSCWGGIIDLVTARRLPLLTIGSGPVAGVVGARILAEAQREAGPAGDEAALEKPRDIITTDMGGTTFDVGVILDHQSVMRSVSRLDQYEYAVPTLDVRSVGAGGGSIVRFNAATRRLQVGPESAGARPGPASFGRGGTQATITDADLVLGYIGEDTFLDGGFHLSRRAAEDALAEVGDEVGMSVTEVAAGAVRIVDAQMADALRLVSVSQGRDPRQFALYAFGGNGPIHTPALANGLGIRTIAIPLGDLASGWSALGVAAADAVVFEEISITFKNPFDMGELEAIWKELEEKTRLRLTAQGIEGSAQKVSRIIEMKYSTQVNQIRFDVTEDVQTGRHLEQQFECEYERRYGQGAGYAAAGFAITMLATRGVGKLSEGLGRRPNSAENRVMSPRSRRDVIWYECGLIPLETPVFRGGEWDQGTSLEGPAIVEFPVATLAIRPNHRASLDGYGTVWIDTGAEQNAGAQGG
jgi:N-methylhydantoinase A